jgi:hypothetical protein
MTVVNGIVGKLNRDIRTERRDVSNQMFCVC